MLPAGVVLDVDHCLPKIQGPVSTTMWALPTSMTTPTTGIWAYRETTWTSGDLTGYKVEARDGDIGKVDKANNQVGLLCLIHRSDRGAQFQTG